eukprot:CAMPEP_0168609052 /NCGR_PEP_ID=MMETSP0449_2-20121227/989_1 /TAXON_ID=1082188 /ORGANISM="Strombidium rassoulzadegani, Strain ras09" /LENGTH=99 /DNA_ID=CAMNT_0008649147 /DNA_START=845 /DNA_END=1140 /DNA_ORIENTATION=+
MSLRRGIKVGLSEHHGTPIGNAASVVGSLTLMEHVLYERASGREDIVLGRSCIVGGGYLTVEEFTLLEHSHLSLGSMSLRRGIKIDLSEHHGTPIGNAA